MEHRVTITLEQMLESSVLAGPPPAAVDPGRNASETGLSLVTAPRLAPASLPRKRVRAGRSRRFVDGVFENDSGARRFRLYSPEGVADGEPAPLIVMLHGAGQDPVDFARATRMHDVAARQGIHVLYVEQGTDSNPARCWNWFRPSDQLRGNGEASILADMTRHVVAENGICPRRVYVAGLSAGAAMAVVLGRTYPDLFAAVGAHSGLAYKAASNVYAAFDVMARGPADSPSRVEPVPGVPTIVFHGDRDSTVHPDNATAIVEQALGRAVDAPGQTTSTTTRRAGELAYTTTAFKDARGQTVVEQWIIHDAEHAWSGGSARGSHAEPRGPDASSEMIRFFDAHALKPRPAAV
jgi:poly(hydroxyalkanoate) depolymerase family esterase